MANYLLFIHYAPPKKYKISLPRLDTKYLGKDFKICVLWQLVYQLWKLNKDSASRSIIRLHYYVLVKCNKLKGQGTIQVFLWQFITLFGDHTRQERLLLNKHVAWVERETTYLFMYLFICVQQMLRTYEVWYYIGLKRNWTPIKVIDSTKAVTQHFLEK